jgi:hypothetical protein
MSSSTTGIPHAMPDGRLEEVAHSDQQKRLPLSFQFQIGWRATDHASSKDSEVEIWL